MFAYCNNNPANRIDPDGHDSCIWEWFSTMWWLCAVDGPYPIGEIVYGIGIAVLTVEYFVTSSQTTEPIILMEEADDQPLPPSPPAPSNNGSHNNKNNKNNKNKLSLKRVTEYLLKKRGLDAHEIKYEYLGNRASVSRYDLFYDSKTGIIYILSKAGEIIYETCYNIYKDMLFR